MERAHEPPEELQRLQFTDDGTPFSPAYGDVYCSRSGRGQAAEVFVGGNRVPERLAGGGRFAVLETGLGLGLNLVATLDALAPRAAFAPVDLRYAAIELHPVHPEDLARVHGGGGVSADAFLRGYARLLEVGFVSFEAAPGVSVRLELVLGDGASALAQLTGTFDALYLDGFAPDRNPGLWNGAVYQELARLAAPGATLATYSAASAVRSGLDAAGFEVRRVAGFGRKRHRIEGGRRATTSP